MIRLLQSLFLLAALLLTRTTQARDLAGIEWVDFAKAATFVFHGSLTKAEVLNADKPGSGDEQIRYTYRIYNVYKGEDLKQVTFDAPSEEDINKEIGTPAIVFLRKENNHWLLSFDQRSCWKYRNEMKKDFHGLGVYDIPETLLYHFPADLAQTVEILVRYGDNYKPESKKRFTAQSVEKKLKAALAAAK